MKGFTSPLIFFAILGAATSKVIKSEDTLENVDPFAIEDCWYKTNPHDPTDEKFMCETTGGALQDPPEDFNTPEKCQAKCVELGPGRVREGGCNHWAFTNLRNGDPKCYVLDDCYEDTQNHCTPTILDNSLCASGPRACATDCPALEYKGGLDKTHWDCIHTGEAVHPYDQTKTIPSGSICTAECPVWKNTNGDLVPKIKATCEDDGSWGDQIPNDPEIGTPGLVPNPPCTCNPIDIDPTTFETTENVGAELYCTDESGDGDLELKKQKFTIQNMMNCIFLCDKQFALEIACTQGTWTNEITDCTEFYCWKRPDTADKCGGSI